MPSKFTGSRQQFVRICECGCGQPTLIAHKSYPSQGITKGVPLRCIKGHSPAFTPKRPNLPADTPRKSPLRYYHIDEIGCWIWERGLTTKGYGQFVEGNTRYTAHRWFYEQRYGTIPEGMHLDHLCRKRNCVNPDHLEPVTPKENSRRGMRRRVHLEDIGPIRKLAKVMNKKDVAKIFGLSSSTVHNVVSGKHWDDVA